MRLRLLLINLFVFTIFINFIPPALLFQWEDEDSVIVEALNADSILKRRGGKFPFTWPWQSDSMTGRARADTTLDPDFTCYTTVGEEGVCATLRECYPMLYSVEYVKETQDGETSNLIDTLKSISGPCDMPNFAKFRIDMPDSVICCPSRIYINQVGGKEKYTPTPSIITPTPPTTTLNSNLKVEINLKNNPSISTPTVNTVQPIKLIKVTPVRDAVAAYYHHEYTCGFINETLPEGMKMEEAQNRFPWIVALVGNRGHFCTGSIIDQYTVLTAASCTSHMTSEDVSNLHVYLGDYRLYSIADGPLIIRKVVRVIYHRGYDSQTLKNDIALLRFKLPAPSGTHRVLPVCLPQKTFKRRKAEIKDNLLVGIEATLAGWGRNWSPSRVPVLQKTKLMIISNDECRQRYGYLARSGITDHMLCAYPRRDPGVMGVQIDAVNQTMNTSRVDSTSVNQNTTSQVQTMDEGQQGRRTQVEIQDCIGDTGGPLVIQNEDKKFELIGIVSWSIGCSNYPYVHTRVGSYLNWIEKNRHR